MAGIAHDVGILIDQEHIVQLHAGIGIGVVGAVPLGLGREHLISLGDVVHISQLAFALQDVDSMLGQASGHGVAVGVSPGAEPVSAALFANGGLNLGRIFSKSPASSVRSMPRAPG